MFRPCRPALALATLALIAGCGPSYSPNTYSAAAVQQANKVDRGEVIGVRPIEISAAGIVGATTGAAAGGAVGGVAGAEPGGGLGGALGAIGGGLIGGLIGTSVEHATTDTKAFEYIVRMTNSQLVSVTQKDATPLTIGTRVLVIEGKQARIVPDYTVDPDPPVQAATEPPPAPVAAQPLPPPDGPPPPTPGL